MEIDLETAILIFCGALLTIFISPCIENPNLFSSPHVFFPSILLFVIAIAAIFSGIRRRETPTSAPRGEVLRHGDLMVNVKNSLVIVGSENTDILSGDEGTDLSAKKADEDNTSSERIYDRLEDIHYDIMGDADIVTGPLELDDEGRCSYLCDRAQERIHQEHYYEAMSITNYAISINARSPYAWKTRGTAAMKLDKLGVARRCFEKSVQYDPKDLDAARKLTLVELRMKNRTIRLFYLIWKIISELRRRV